MVSSPTQNPKADRYKERPIKKGGKSEYNFLEREGNYTASSRKKRYLERPIKSLNILLLTRISRLLGLSNLPIVRTTTFWGDKMKVILPDGAPIYLWGYIDGEELNLTRFILGNLEEEDIVFDVGAHFGYYSLLSAWLVGDSGKVVSFEPTPRTFDILSFNTTKKNNILVCKKALWRESGFAELSDFGADSSSFNTIMPLAKYPDKTVIEGNRGNTKNIKVRTTTLDKFCTDNKITPNFIKLDAEGAELDILKGAHNTLSTKPLLSVELWGGEDGESNSSEIIKLLGNYGYSPYVFYDGVLSPLVFDSHKKFINAIFK